MRYGRLLPLMALALFLVVSPAVGEETSAGEGGDTGLDITILTPSDGEKIIGNRVDIKFTLTGFTPGDGFLAVHLDQRMLTGQKTFFTFEGVSSGDHRLVVEYRKGKFSYPTVRRVIGIVTEPSGDAGVKKEIQGVIGEGMVDPDFLYFRLGSVKADLDEEGALAIEANLHLQNQLRYGPIQVEVKEIVLVDAEGNSYPASPVPGGKGHLLLQAFKDQKLKVLFRIPPSEEGGYPEGLRLIYLTERGTRFIYPIPQEEISSMPVS